MPIGPQPDDVIEVPDAPPVPGLAFRGFRGEEDLLRFLEVFDECKAVDGFWWTLTVEELKPLYEVAEGFEPGKDVLVVEVDGQVVGYLRHFWNEGTDGSTGHQVRDGLHPRWRGLGIGRAMLRWCERRSREVEGERRSGSPARMVILVTEGEAEKRARVEAGGYMPAHFLFEMLRDLREPIPDLPIPPGLEVRPVVGEENAWKVHEASNEALLDHPGYTKWTSDHFRHFMSNPNYQPDLWTVAWDGDEPAGSVWGWIHEEENRENARLWGYTERISVRRPYRRRGLARALIALAMRNLRERGMEHACLAVDTDNPHSALSLYEGLGYHVNKKMTIYEKALDREGVDGG